MNSFEKVFYSEEELKDFGVVNLNNSFASVVEDIDLDKYLIHFGGYGELFSNLLEGVDKICNYKDANHLFSTPVLYNLSKNIVKRGILKGTEINSMFRNSDDGDRYLKVCFNKRVDSVSNCISIELKLISYNTNMSVGRGDNFIIYLKNKREVMDIQNRVDNSCLSNSAKKYLKGLFSTCHPFELSYDRVLSSIGDTVSYKIDEFLVDTRLDNIYSIYNGIKTFLIVSFNTDDVLCHFINDISFSVSDDCLVVFFNEKKVKSIKKVVYPRCLEEVV